MSTEYTWFEQLLDGDAEAGTGMIVRERTCLHAEYEQGSYSLAEIPGTRVLRFWRGPYTETLYLLEEDIEAAAKLLVKIRKNRTVRP